MKQSAGILVYRKRGNSIEVLLVHLAGPFWEKKDVWSIPKGEHNNDEDHLAAAKREFEEELGIRPPTGKLLNLGTAKSSSKTNYIWAVQGDVHLEHLKFESTFTMEWPPRSGKTQEFLENDRAEWFDLATAKTKLLKAQMVFIDRLADKLNISIPNSGVNSTPEKSDNQQVSLL